MQPPWATTRCGFATRRLGSGDGMGIQASDSPGICVDACACGALERCSVPDCWVPLVDGCEADCQTSEDMKALGGCALILLCSIHILAQCGFMVKYQRHVVAKKPKLSDLLPSERRASAGNFRTSIRDECCMALHCWVCRSQDSSLCLHSCCCRGIRMADTYASAGLGGFYCNAFMFFGTLYAFPVCLSVVAGVKHSMWLGRVALALVLAARRWQLLRRLGSSGGSWMDCLLLLFCTPCATCQEARHVDGALGVQVECCCVLVGVQDDNISLVGIPVAIGEQGLL